MVSARLELGELACVEPETLAFAFQVVALGTAAEGCELLVERLPLVVRCAACGREGEADPAVLVCPACGGTPLTVLSGRELRLASIDVEDQPTEIPT